MIVDPFRWWRRHRRLLREAQEEVQYLRRRHGELALAAAREKLKRPDLTDWGRCVVARAIREMARGQPAAGIAGQEKGGRSLSDRPLA